MNFRNQSWIRFRSERFFKDCVINPESRPASLPAGSTFAVTIGSYSAEVLKVTQQNPFVLRVDVRIPAVVTTAVAQVAVEFNTESAAVQAGPLSVPPSPLYHGSAEPVSLGLWIAH